MKKIITFVMAGLLVFSLAACSSNKGGGSSDTYPMSITDAEGIEVKIEKEPQKIVSLAPNCTEILYAIGAGDKMVGVSTWCTYPEEATKVEAVGDTYSINTERIVELGADIIFTSSSFSADSLENLGIPVVVVNAATMDELYEQIIQVGRIVGCKDNAVKVTDDMKKQLETLADKLKNAEERKVFLDWGAQYSSSKKDLLGNALELVKAENIAYDYDYTSPQLSAETIIEKNPDVYIVGSSEADFVKPVGFDEISAFKNGEVHYIDYADPTIDKITRSGPRFVEGLVELAKMIHPEIEL